MRNRCWLRLLGGWIAVLVLVSVSGAAQRDGDRPLSVLLLTADDLHCESVGAFGGRIADLTPNLDRLASQGMRFCRAHVNAAICQPSRGVLGTGRYGHNSGIMGFMHADRELPTIMETLRGAGYLTGVLGKVGHSTPEADYRWDFVHDRGELGAGRDPQLYYRYCREFLQRCRKENRPFYFMVNSHDPHRPFHVPGKPIRGAVEPSRTYRPEEVPVPGFVPDLPGVRQSQRERSLLGQQPVALHQHALSYIQKDAVLYQPEAAGIRPHAPRAAIELAVVDAPTLAVAAHGHGSGGAVVVDEAFEGESGYAGGPPRARDRSAWSHRRNGRAHHPAYNESHALPGCSDGPSPP